MEQITAIKITGLSFTDFRNHTDKEHYSFGDISYISGHNGTGKTTMAHGVAYALYGVSYYGEQKIERLMNENATGTQVELEFVDQNGTAHTLIRTRKNDKISLALDSYSVRQTDIDRIFCDKETFLSMFNPTYLIERLGEKGRELIIKYLKPVSSKEVLLQIGSLRGYLDEVNLEGASPESHLKNYRASIHQSERKFTMLEGNIQSLEEAHAVSEQKLSALLDEKSVIEEKVNQLVSRQFENIDLDELAIQRDLLLAKLTESTETTDSKISETKAQIEALKQSCYVPKYAQVQAETRAEIKVLSQKYTALNNRLQALKPETQCPTCLMKITEQNLQDVRKGIMTELKSIALQGNELGARQKEINELERKSQATFEQFKAEDIEKLTAELTTLKQSHAKEPTHSEIREHLEQLDEYQKYGNLSEAEYTELSSLKAELTGINAQIKVIAETADEARLKSALDEKNELETQIIKYKNIVSALTEYICKRTELATRDIQMPNVQIRLFDVVRTTGEVVSVFKFSYKGRDYSTLSLSEKTLAGVEVSAMVRKITGIDCPICIDNTECIAAFNSVSMPSQTLLLRFIKGQPLTVQFRNNIQIQQPAEMRKAS